MARKETSASTPSLPKISSGTQTDNTKDIISGLKSEIGTLQEQLVKDTGLKIGLQNILSSMKKSNINLQKRTDLSKKVAYRNSIKDRQIQPTVKESLDRSSSPEQSASDLGSGKMLAVIAGMLFLGGKFIMSNIMGPKTEQAIKKKIATATAKKIATSTAKKQDYTTGEHWGGDNIQTLKNIEKIRRQEKITADKVAQFKREKEIADFKYEAKGFGIEDVSGEIDDPVVLRQAAFYRQQEIIRAEQERIERLRILGRDFPEGQSSKEQNSKMLSIMSAFGDRQNKKRKMQKELKRKRLERLAREKKAKEKFKIKQKALAASIGGVEVYGNKFADKTEGEGGFFDFSLKEIATAKHQQRINRLKAKRARERTAIENRERAEASDFSFFTTSGYTDDMLLRRKITRESFPDTDDRDFYRPAWQWMDKKFKRFYPYPSKLRSKLRGGIQLAAYNSSMTSKPNFNRIKEILGEKESGGDYQITNSDNYVGKYQFGYRALIEVGEVKSSTTHNDDLIHKPWVWIQPGGLTAFLNSPQRQEKAMDKYLEINYGRLSASIPGFKNLTIEQKAGLLGAAHLAGASGTRKWYNSLDESRDEVGFASGGPKDKFGTRPGDYFRTLIREYNDTLAQNGITSKTYRIASALSSSGSGGYGNVTAGFRQGDRVLNDVGAGAFYNYNPVVVNEHKKDWPKNSVFTV